MKLNKIEKSVIQYFLSTKGISIDAPDMFFSDLSVKERDYTGKGFFSYFEKFEKLKITDKDETYIHSDININFRINDQIDTGYLIYIEDGFIECIEGFTYEGNWPEDIHTVKFFEIE